MLLKLHPFQFGIQSDREFSSFRQRENKRIGKESACVWQLPDLTYMVDGGSSIPVLELCLPGRDNPAKLILGQSC